MLKIAICDDNISFLEKIEKLIEVSLRGKNISFKVFSFNKSDELLRVAKKEQYDIVFLDVEMAPYNGIDSGSKLREIKPNIILVYISSYIDYSIKGYKVQAFRYILKNGLEEIFEEEINDILSEHNRINEYFTYKKEGEPIKVLYEDIVYLMSEGRKVNIVTKDNHKHEFYAKLDDLEESFENKYFLRVHQSYMVNVRYSLKLKNYEIFLINDIVLPTSKKEFQILKEKYAKIKGQI